MYLDLESLRFNYASVKLLQNLSRGWTKLATVAIKTGNIALARNYLPLLMTGAEFTGAELHVQCISNMSHQYYTCTVIVRNLKAQLLFISSCGDPNKIQTHTYIVHTTANQTFTVIILILRGKDISLFPCNYFCKDIWDGWVGVRW